MPMPNKLTTDQFNSILRKIVHRACIGQSIDDLYEVHRALATYTERLENRIAERVAEKLGESRCQATLFAPRTRR